MKTLSFIFCISAVVCLSAACTKTDPDVMETPEESPSVQFSPRDVAVMLSSIPIQNEHLSEVFSAVNCSSDNGYDEEYTLKDLFACPGQGVGGAVSKAPVKSWDNPLKNLIKEYLSSTVSTKAGAAEEQEYLSCLSESDMQIYWPYSEDWDGETFPVITFDPGKNVESNYGYVVSKGPEGVRVVDSIIVTEATAKTRPVWVINTNDDSGFTTLTLLEKQTKSAGQVEVQKSSSGQKMTLKRFKMLRNYDSWFAGASEFFVKCGSVDGFKAKTEEEMKQYCPSITDFLVVVKRKQLGQDLSLDCLLMTDFTDQMDKIAFLITEDDGGTQTTWKCAATVKVKSKSYGFDLEFPLNSKDDIVWRGQLSADYFREGPEVSGRFGDVVVTFGLE